MSESLCKGCGRPIIWGETFEGKKVPLDPRAPVYTFSGSDSGSGLRKILRLGSDEGIVSHFSTCPKANDFSASKRQPTAA